MQLLSRFLKYNVEKFACSTAYYFPEFFIPHAPPHTLPQIGLDISCGGDHGQEDEKVKTNVCTLLEFLKGYVCVFGKGGGGQKIFLSSIVELEMFSGTTVLLN